jgi:hypothetical protein
VKHFAVAAEKAQAAAAAEAERAAAAAQAEAKASEAGRKAARTKRLNAKEAEAAAARVEAERKAKDIHSASHRIFANNLLMIISEQLLTHLTALMPARADPSDAKEIYSKMLFDEHVQIISNHLVKNKTEGTSNIDDELMNNFKNMINTMCNCIKTTINKDGQDIPSPDKFTSPTVLTPNMIDTIKRLFGKNDMNSNYATNIIWNKAYTKKYIINNSAPFDDMIGVKTSDSSEDLYDLMFCPYSSIIDPGGFGACTPANAGELGQESGDMKVDIKSTFGDGAFISYEANIPKATQLGYEITFNKPGEFNTSYGTIGRPVFQGDGQNSLSVANTYIDVCGKLIEYIKENTGDNMWNELQGTETLNNIISIILRKSKGDLLQEFSAVLYNGGYNGDVTYNPANKIYEWVSGQALRCFLANDKPSAIRFIFFKLFFPEDNINKKAFGGFISEMTTGNKNLYVISRGGFGGSTDLIMGGGSKQRKTKKKSKKKNKKLNKKSKKSKKKSKKSNKRTKKNGQKAGTTKLGRCYIEDLPNNNLKLILGRRKYITKYLDSDGRARDYIYKIANDPLRKQECISIARILDKELKTYKKTKKKKTINYNNRSK